MTRRGPRARARPASPSAAGYVLVVVLAVLAVLTSLLWLALSRAMTERRLAAAGAEQARLRAAAAAAARRALQRIADDEDPAVDATNDVWALPETLVDPDGVAVRVRAEDENRRVDLNNLAVPDVPGRRTPAAGILERLLRACGDPAPGARVEALRDRVDADHEGPYETANARGGESPPGADRPLDGWRGLDAVPGWDAAYLADPTGGRPGARPRVRPTEVLTVVPGARTEVLAVNLNTASPAVLQALFGPGREAVADAVVSLRRAAPLRSLDPLAVLVDPLALERLRPWLALHGTVFRVTADARRDAVAVRVVALARRDTGALHIVRWSEGVPP